MSDTKQLTPFDNFKVTMAKQYQKQIENYFGDPKKALSFMSAMMSDLQRTPKLLECNQMSLINSYMIMAQMQFMPSGISGEAYVIPYSIKGNMTAQFQLGYQGLVTMFYRAGVRSIVAEIVRKNDSFSYVNGIVTHEPDVFSDNRGEPIGAYVVVELQAGGKVYKVMSKKEIQAILDISKNPKTLTDPEYWRWKKTVLKQIAKLVPKNETIYKAIDLDNQDSLIAETKKQETFNLLEAPTVEPEPESTEWRDKLAAQLMQHGSAAPEDDWNTEKYGEYPKTEDEAKAAYGRLLNEKQ